MNPENAHGNAVVMAPSSLDAETTAERAMMRVRQDFGPLFKMVIVGVCILIAITAVVSLVLVFRGTGATETGLYVRLIQVTFGMVLGAACIYFGVVLSWLGITATAVISAEGTAGASGKATLGTTSPGIVLALGGMLLIGASLYKPIEFQETVTNVPTHIEPKNIPKGQ